MATQQEELLKALKGNSGREQVNFDLGQVGLRPTIQRAGQYNVQVQEAPRTNPALQLASALKGTSQVLGDFVDIQAKQGEIEANALSPQEVQKLVEQGDPNAVSFLDKLGKEKTFVETTYKRYYTSTVQPQLQALSDELKNKPVHEYADEGITTPEDYNAYATKRVQELTNKFGEYASKSPYANTLHNQLIEEVVPKFIQQHVSQFDENVTKYNKESAAENLISFDNNNGVNLAPEASTQSGTHVVAPDGSTITEFGQTGKRGGYKDPLLDSASAVGIGANVPDTEAAKIKKGLPSKYKMKQGDIAVSSDVKDQFLKNNIKMGDTVSVILDDGTTHTGRWMDVTATSFEGKPLTGRFDIYTPEGRNPLTGKKVKGFTLDAASVENGFNESVNTIHEANASRLAAAGYSPTETSKIIREKTAAQIKSLSSEGKFIEARKLMSALRVSNLGGQPLFGSIDGRLMFDSMNDLIDREEEQDSNKNSAEEERKNRELAAEYEIKYLRSVRDGKNSEDVMTTLKDEVLQNQELTNYQRSSILKSIDQASSQQYSANLKASAVVEKATQDYNLALETKNTFVAASTQSNAYEWSSLNLPKEALEAITVKNLNGQVAMKDGAVALLRQSIDEAKYDTDEATYNLAQGLRLNNEVEYNGVTYDTSTEAKKREVGAKLGKILNQQLTENIRTRFSNNLTKSRLAPIEEVGVSPEEQAAYDAKLVEYGGDAKMAKVALEVEKRKVNQENSVVNKDGTVRFGKEWAEDPYTFASKVNNTLTKGLIKTAKGEPDFDSSFKVFAAAKAEVHKSQSYGYDLDDYYNAPIGSKQQSQAIRNIRSSFEQVGFPTDAIQTGIIEKKVPKLGSPNETKTVLFPIAEDFLKNKEAYKTIPIIPAHWLQRRDEPAYSSAIDKFKTKWGVSDEQVADQESLYNARGIKTIK